MKTGLEILKERGVDTSQDTIPCGEIERVGLPVVVSCSGCCMTMCIASALVDSENNVWCADCAPRED